MFRSLIDTTDDRIPMLARLALGIVIFPHGAQKLLAWFGGPGIDGALGFSSGLGIPAFLGWVVILTEFFGGIALVVGLMSRVAALAIAINMIVAVVTTNWKFGFFMNWNGQLQEGGEGFEFHVLAITLALIVIIRGSGALSLDRALMRRAAAA